MLNMYMHVFPFQTSDMTFAASAILAERLAYTDYSFPFYKEETGVIYKFDASPISKAFLFIRPFKWQVWVCVMALIPSIGFCFWCFGHCVRSIHKRNRLNKSSKGTSFADSLWLALGPLFSQGMKSIGVFLNDVITSKKRIGCHLLTLHHIYISLISIFDLRNERQ